MRTALALAAAWALGAAAPAHATFPGINGDLAFTDGSGGIATRPLGGPMAPGAQPADAVPLAPAGAPALDARWSPDGARIVYSSAVSGDPEVYVLDVSRAGSLPVRLTSSPGRDTDPSFSADGRSIAFMSDRAGNPDVWVMRDDGGDQRPVTTDPAADQQPEYSSRPDGRIAFESDRDGDRELYLVSDDGTGETRLTSHPGIDADASWSPDGRLLAYTTGAGAYPEDIAVMAAAAGAPPRIITAGTSTASQFPAWSPDGLHIAYSSFSTAPSVGVTSADGSAPVSYAGSGWDADWGVLRPADPEARPATRTATVGGSSQVLIKPPGARAARPLSDAGSEAGPAGGPPLSPSPPRPRSIPFGTRINAQPAGQPLDVDLDVAVVRRGPVLHTRVTGGVYTLRREGDALTFDMAPPTCPRGRNAAASVLPRNDVKIRRTGGQGAVATRSRRRHVRTYTRDTEYRVVETCRRMVIRVLDGKLRVTRPPPRGLPYTGPSRPQVLKKGQKVVIP